MSMMMGGRVRTMATRIYQAFPAHRHENRTPGGPCGDPFPTAMGSAYISPTFPRAERMPIQFSIRGEYIQLDQLLKAASLVSSGGAAHAAVEAGLVKVGALHGSSSSSSTDQRPPRPGPHTNHA